MSGKFRSVKHTRQFDRELAQLHPDFRRADEAAFAAQWILCRDPETGTQLLDSEVWVLPMQAVPDFPAVTVFYTFDENTVYFLSIRPALSFDS